MKSKEKKETKLLTGRILLASVKESFVKLAPSNQIKNPVIFIVLIGAVVSCVLS
jgi:K+-transporting ATPase ATPase B chain